MNGFTQPLPECTKHWQCSELLLLDGNRLHRAHSESGASPLFIGESVVTWFLRGYPGQASWYSVTFPLTQVDQIAQHNDPGIK